MRLPSRRFRRGAEEGADGSLAVSAGDMEDRRQRTFWIAEPLEQPLDAIKSKNIRTGREGREAIELRLNRRIVRSRAIRHLAAQAAFGTGVRNSMS